MRNLIRKIIAKLRRQKKAPQPEITPLEAARELGERLRRGIDNYSLLLNGLELDKKLSDEVFGQVVKWHQQFTNGGGRIFDEIAILHQREIAERNAARIAAAEQELSHG